MLRRVDVENYIISKVSEFNENIKVINPNKLENVDYSSLVYVTDTDSIVVNDNSGIGSFSVFLQVKNFNELENKIKFISKILHKKNINNVVLLVERIEIRANNNIYVAEFRINYVCKLF